jgi:hypothetical protein
MATQQVCLTDSTKRLSCCGINRSGCTRGTPLQPHVLAFSDAHAHTGTFDTAEEAALVYDAACRELRGNIKNVKNVNFPNVDAATATM